MLRTVMIPVPSHLGLDQMTSTAPTYDLVLLLDQAAEEPVRTKIVADARDAISAGGELLRHDEWGDRVLTYPIDHKLGAEYHLLQFHASSPNLLRDLDRTLKITDGVIRFRIVKLKPGTPAAPDMGLAHDSASRPRQDSEPVDELALAES
jgi:small subunit ribosomal protein S6